MTATARPSHPVIFIPARMASTRLPDKPLADIHGAPMIVHVWRRAMEAKIGPVFVACAEESIKQAVEAAGGQAVLTDPNHPSGSDRIFEALCRIDPNRQFDAVVNVQADLPTLDPALIRRALDPLAEAAVDIATLAVEIVREEERHDPNVVKAVAAFGKQEAGGKRSGIAQALYFSRATVPANADGAVGPQYHHIGPAAGLRAAAAELRAGRWRTLVPALALAGGAAILANWPVAPRLRQQMRAVMLNNVAAGHLRHDGNLG